MSHWRHRFDGDVTRVVPAGLGDAISGNWWTDNRQPELKKSKQNNISDSFSSFRIIRLAFPPKPQFHDVEKLSVKCTHESNCPQAHLASSTVIANSINQRYVFNEIDSEVTEP